MFALGSQGWLPTASSPNWPSWSFGTLWDFSRSRHTSHSLPQVSIHSYQRKLLHTQYSCSSITETLALNIFFFFPPALALEVRGFGCYLCDWFHLPVLLPVPQWSYNLYGRDLQRVTCIYPIANWNLKKGTHHNGLRPPRWTAAKQQELDEPSWWSCGWSLDDSLWYTQNTTRFSL